MMRNLSLSDALDHIQTAPNNTCYNDTSCLGETGGTAIDDRGQNWGLMGLLLVIACTALGNMLVCLAVCWDRRLQNMTNYFLMSLAIADFLVSIIVMPFGMIVEIYGYFPLTVEFCTFWVTMDVLMCTASIWHMCTMSMDRYFTLKYPMQYGRNKTKTMVVIKIVFVWMLSITISSPICIYGLVDSSAVYTPDRLCLITSVQYAIYGSIFAFYIPLCIMILTYLLTLRILRQNQKLMRTIERSDFKLRSYSGGSKSCRIKTLVSPPSSDNRRESHTDVSSVCRTPVRESMTIIRDESDRTIKELSIANSCSMPISEDQSNKCENNNTNKFCDGKTFVDKKELSDQKTENNPNKADPSYYNRKKGELVIPSTRVQSPSSEDEDDEYTKLLQSPGNTRRASANSQSSNSSESSKFRLRTNTNVSSRSYPMHSSLKIPRSVEKQNLQGSVSCSNFYDDPEIAAVMSLAGGNHRLANRDYKSLEWCQHFYQIQAEMDQCLRESQLERQTKRSSCPKAGACDILGEYTTVNGAADDQAREATKDELKPDPAYSADVSESGESLDDSSSENANSDLLTIKLYPKTAYMYRLDVPTKTGSPRPPDPAENRPNGIMKRGSYSRADSLDSDKSDPNKISEKRSSIKRFLSRCKSNRKLKHFISSKTTSNEKKASKVLGIIFAVFVILWTPFFIANIVSALCMTCITGQLMSAFVWLGYVASLANPIIYTMFNTAFRRAFIRILSCHMCRHKRRDFHGYSNRSCYAASVYTDRRQTLTVLLNNQERITSADLTSNNFSGSGR